jgi:hypothetical protein
VNEADPVAGGPGGWKGQGDSPHLKRQPLRAVGMPSALLTLAGSEEGRPTFWLSTLQQGISHSKKTVGTKTVFKEHRSLGTELHPKKLV